MSCSKEEEDHRLGLLIRLHIPYCSSLCYASETVALKEFTKRKKTLITERKIPRRIFGPAKDRDGTWRIKTNDELNNLIGNKQYN